MPNYGRAGSSPVLGTKWPLLAGMAVFVLLLAELLPKSLLFSFKKMEKPYPYKKAKVYEGDQIYIEFWAWSLKREDLARKRFFKIPGESKREKLQEARRLVKHINLLLKDGHILKDGSEDSDNDLLAPLGVLAAIKKALDAREEKNNIY